LMKHFGSIRAISAASIEDLAALDGMTHGAAEKVKEYIGQVEYESSRIFAKPF
jgi:excinuclease ABC subunit C